MEYLTLLWNNRFKVLVIAYAILAFIDVRAHLEISRLNGQLDAFDKAPKAEQNQVQAVSGTANAFAKISIKQKPCPVAGKECPPCECPDILIEAGAASTLTMTAQQSQKQGVQPVAVAKEKTFFVGAGIGLLGPIKGAPKVNIETPFIYGGQLQADVYFPPKLYATELKDQIAASASLNWGF